MFDAPHGSLFNQFPIPPHHPNPKTSPEARIGSERNSIEEAAVTPLQKFHCLHIQEPAFSSQLNAIYTLPRQCIHFKIVKHDEIICLCAQPYFKTLLLADKRQLENCNRGASYKVLLNLTQKVVRQLQRDQYVCKSREFKPHIEKQR